VKRITEANCKAEDLRRRIKFVSEYAAFIHEAALQLVKDYSERIKELGAQDARDHSVHIWANKELRNTMKKDKGKKKVEKVMGEYKKGALKSSGGSKVTQKKQAIAIALSEGKKASKGKQGAKK
jgi:hypothetical protein